MSVDSSTMLTLPGNAKVPSKETARISFEAHYSDRSEEQAVPDPKQESDSTVTRSASVGPAEEAGPPRTEDSYLSELLLAEAERKAQEQPPSTSICNAAASLTVMSINGTVSSPGRSILIPAASEFKPLSSSNSTTSADNAGESNDAAAQSRQDSRA